MELTFMQCSQHQGQAPVANGKGIAGFDPFMAGATEMSNGRTSFVHRMEVGLGEDFAVHHRHQPGTRRGEVAVIRNRRKRLWKVLDVEVHQLSKDLNQSPKGLDHDRYLIIVKVKHLINRRKVAFIETHWNAVIQSEHSGRNNTDRARVMDNAGETLERIINRLQMHDYEVVVGGDFNYRVATGSNDWKWAPENIFTRQGMQYFDRGLDYIAWTNGFEKKNHQVIEPGTSGNHADHPWLLVRLILPWRRR